MTYAHLDPGEEVVWETTAPAAWAFRDGNGEIVSRVNVERNLGAKQAFSSTDGFLPTPETPVTLVIAPRGDGGPLDVAYVAHGEEEVRYATLDRGRAEQVDTYHGHEWRLYDAAGALVAARVVDARDGHVQTLQHALRDEI